MATDDQILKVIQYVFDWMPTDTNDRCVAFCNEVAHQLRGTGYELAAGLIAKNAGQEHGTGADGQLYAVDAIWIAVPTRSADILISAPTASQPWLYWYVGQQLPPSDSYRTPYGSRVLPLYDSGTPPTPPDPPDPPAPECRYAPTDLSGLEARLDRLEQQHLQLLAEIRSGGWPVRVSNGWLTLSGAVGAKVTR